MLLGWHAATLCVRCPVKLTVICSGTKRTSNHLDLCNVQDTAHGLRSLRERPVHLGLQCLLSDHAIPGKRGATGCRKGGAGDIDGSAAAEPLSWVQPQPLCMVRDFEAVAVTTWQLPYVKAWAVAGASSGTSPRARTHDDQLNALPTTRRPTIAPESASCHAVRQCQTPRKCMRHT